MPKNGKYLTKDTANTECAKSLATANGNTNTEPAESINRATLKTLQNDDAHTKCSNSLTG